jgi:hypothetical protein
LIHHQLGAFLSLSKQTEESDYQRESCLLWRQRSVEEIPFAPDRATTPVDQLQNTSLSKLEMPKGRTLTSFHDCQDFWSALQRSVHLGVELEECVHNLLLRKRSLKSAFHCTRGIKQVW